MKTNKTTFALYFGNRGFFPGEVIAKAREEMKTAVKNAGFGYIDLSENETRYGAVETIEEGLKYASFLAENAGNYDGVIICLPNFGDENGAYYALKDCGVPVLVQAYPDEIGKMDFAHRRDAVCGKIAMCNVLRQAGIKYTLTEKFALSPLSGEFAKELVDFAAVCRIVKGMSQFTIGEIGARTSAFKTVRVDEIAMQKKRVNVETIDLARVFAMMDALEEKDVTDKKNYLKELADFGCYKEEKVENLARLGVVIDRLVDEYKFDAVAIRCWDELQKKYGIAPCLLLGDLNERGICAACESDVNNALSMRALMLASDHPVMLYDVNNNYGTDEKKAVLFHCGPSPKSMMKGKGRIEEHLMFKKSYGSETGVGLYVAEVEPTETTIACTKTENGKICTFVSEGRLTDDKIEKGFFGCGTVFEKAEGTANDLLNYMSREGYRHHVAIAKGKWAKAVNEALSKYLEYETDRI